MEKVNRTMLAIAFVIGIVILMFHPDLKFSLGYAVLISTLFVVAVIGLEWWFEFSAKGERDGLRIVAEELRLEYVPLTEYDESFDAPIPPMDIVPIPVNKPMGKPVHYVSPRHLLYGIRNGLDISICEVHAGADYDGKGSWSLEQSVIFAQPNEEVLLPEFEIRLSKFGTPRKGIAIFEAKRYPKLAKYRLITSGSQSETWFDTKSVCRIAESFGKFPQQPLSLSFKDGFFVFYVADLTLPIPRKVDRSDSVLSTAIGDWNSFIESATSMFRALIDIKPPSESRS